MPRILTVDDDPQQLDFRMTLLEEAGHAVVGALSTQQAMREIEKGGTDLMIMDLRFPNAQGEAEAKEGMELIRHVRESGCAIPIIVLSGWPEELYGSAEERMVSRIMLKPVRPRELLEAVGQAVSVG